MSSDRTPIMILMADDDEDDCLLTQEALAESRLKNELRFVGDGVELLEYLRNEGRYQDAAKHPRPGIILLDLNMPRKDGRQVLEEIKQDASLRRIPVVVMTTSQAEQDILRSYDLGAASYITKPVTFEGLVEVMRAIGRYWVEFVALPQE
jgi:CheY-like chemotaxis protein